MNKKGYILNQHVTNEKLSYFVFIIFLIFYYYITLPEILTIDSLSYAYSVREGENLLHPHHLIYNVSARGLFLFLNLINKDIDAIFSIQIHNIIYTILFIHVTFLFLKKTGISFVWSIFGTGSMALSYEVWRMTGACEVYIPSIFFSVLTLYLLNNSNFKNSFHNKLLISVLLTLSILYHQLGIILCPALIIMGWKYNKINGVFASFHIIIFAGILTMIAYIISLYYLNIPIKIKSFTNFLFDYNINGPQTWGTFKNFSINGFLQIIRSLTSGIYPISQNKLAVFQIITLIIYILTITFTIRELKKKSQQNNKVYTKVLLVWLFSYILFIWWWIPGEWEFFITPTWIILFLFMHLTKYKHLIMKIFISTILLTIYLFNTLAAIETSVKPWVLKNETINKYSGYNNEYLIIDNHMENEIAKYYLHMNVININWVLNEIHNKRKNKLNSLYGNKKIIPVKYLDPDFKSKDYNYHVSDESWFDVFCWITCFEKTENNQYRSYTWDIKLENGEQLLITNYPFQRFENEMEYRQSLKKSFHNINNKIESKL